MRSRRTVIGHLRLAGLLTLFALSIDVAWGDAVVFMYHRFGEDKFPSTNIRLDQFDAHLEHLHDAGYQVWPLTRIAEAVRAGEKIPDRTVAITVDDAYASVYHQAYPRLKQRGWPFTVFVASDPVDRGFRDYMSWGQMREMQQHGAQFANHSASHDYLIQKQKGETSAQWTQRVKADIKRGEQRLRDELGVDTKLFAYPYGEYDETLATILKNSGYIAFGQQSGAIGQWSDKLALPRYPMAEAYGAPDEFRIKAASLALPVISVTPWNPVLTSTSPPELVVELTDSQGYLNQITCYATGQDRLDVKWINHKRFSVTALRPWNSRRARYNCTAPAAEQGRFYWYSHPWIMPAIAE